MTCTQKIMLACVATFFLVTVLEGLLLWWWLKQDLHEPIPMVNPNHRPDDFYDA